MLPNIRLLTVVSLVSFAANWQFGYQITYINTASNTFYRLANQAEFNSTNDVIGSGEWTNQWSSIVSSFYPGTFIGFVLVPFLVKRVGVKNALLVSSFPAIFGCTIQLFGRFASKIGELAFVGDLIIGRFFVGIHAGSSLCLLPLFTIETSPAESRPFLSSLQQVFQALATLLGLVFGSNDLIPVNGFRFEFLQIIAAFPTVFFVIFLWKLPRTPFRVIDTFPRGSTEADLRRSLNFYYNSVDFSIEQVKAEAFSRWQINLQKSQIQELKSAENIRGLFVGSLAAISYAFTADDVIDSYSNEILYASGQKQSSQAITVSYGILLFVTSIFGAFLVDRFGRKKLIVFGLLGTAFFNSFAIIGNVFHFLPLEVVGFALTKSAIGLGAGAPAWFLTSELVSHRVTHLCQSVSTGALLMASGLCTYIYPLLSNFLGIYALLVVAILPAVISAVILFFFLPETKNKTQEEIQQKLSLKIFPGLHSKMPKESWTQHANEKQPFMPKMVRKYGTSEVDFPSIF